MTENEFLLQDRIAKIKSMDELYDLEYNAYISFSGGKDSTVLSHLIDLALPDNTIPRVYLNTGIEYKLLVAFVERERERDNRIQIVAPSQNIKSVLEQYGYPFKSKEHSLYLSIFQRSGVTKTITRYLTREDKRYACPEKFRYQFTKDFTLKISSMCCNKLKKEVAHKWQKENNRPITITGMRNGEGGLRAEIKGCAIFADNKLKKFHPLLPVEENFIDWYIFQNNIHLCELYYEPYFFKRTGCKGCPFSLNLQEQLDIMAAYLPEERKQVEYIWGKIYDEYRRLGYRLKPSLFDNMQ